MQLRFELGDAQAPRGHALLYARASGGAERYLATYCVVLPIQFSIGKYLPPILASQMPIEAMSQGVADVSAMPIPLMLEDADSLAALRQLAERRGDDFCDLGTLLIGNDSHRLTFAAEACTEYGQLYMAYRRSWPEPEAPGATALSPLDDVDVDAMVASVLPERARLGELARLISSARYALEGGDQRQLDMITRDLQRLAHSLPEKYRAELMVEAALRTDPTGPRLAELYLQRAYKLADEHYIDIPPIEQEIRALRGGEDEGTVGPVTP
ncbi:MAG: hypothetical protein IVW57_04295 [Ktedonobacterales bacterium]|nr:hypothetical protein [Ktedonobacterales bacterium]